LKILSTPRMERCIGRHSCSLARARLVYKHLSWDTAGIRIRSTGGLSTGFEARPCLACDPAPCTAACPTGAFTQRKGGGGRAALSLRFEDLDALAITGKAKRPSCVVVGSRILVFFISQALGLRHSHLDAGGYSYDQKQHEKDVSGAVAFLVQDEKARVFLTSIVACLFAREVYKEPVLADCLRAVGYGNLAENVKSVAGNVQKMRWQIRIKTGFDPGSVKIPERFTQVVTWKGPLNKDYLDALQKAYAQKIREMATWEDNGSPKIG
jgi:aldehyde:ferredoxin oxidoreductase